MHFKCHIIFSLFFSTTYLINKLVLSYVFTVAKTFDIPTLDLKVYDESKTEVDEEAFEFLLKKQGLGVLEVCLPQDPNPDDS